MLYAKLSILFVILAYALTPSASKSFYLESLQAKEIRTSTGTLAKGVATKISYSGSNNQEKLKTGGIICGTECKKVTLTKIGIKKEFAESIVKTCKAKATEPIHCIKVASSIITAESGGGFNCKNWNCLGMGGGKFKYKSVDEAMEHWTKSYVKYWYKAFGLCLFSILLSDRSLKADIVRVNFRQIVKYDVQWA